MDENEEIKKNEYSEEDRLFMLQTLEKLILQETAFLIVNKIRQHLIANETLTTADFNRFVKEASQKDMEDKEYIEIKKELENILSKPKSI